MKKQNKQTKTCFVVMGFGKKMDYRNSRELNLDIIYDKIIKKTFEDFFPDYKVLRANEIVGSSIIDTEMYELLLNADLVVADITTLNENAIYELGVRHALRPYSTIIMMMKFGKSDFIPFDLSHSRFMMYNDFGEWLDDNEAECIRLQLAEYVRESEKHHTDSPFYTYVHDVDPPKCRISDKTIDKVEEKEEVINSLLDEYKSLISESKFIDALPIIKRLSDTLPNNEYIIQQHAFCTYKAEIPDKLSALYDANRIISRLSPDTSLNLETLGIAGSINKRLYLVNKKIDYLDKAIKLYLKGYIIKKDYYNGENVINCFYLKIENSTDQNEINSLDFFINRIAHNLIDSIHNSLSDREINHWMYATLSTCYHIINDEENSAAYGNIFCSKAKDWEEATYRENLNLIDRGKKKCVKPECI